MNDEPDPDRVIQAVIMFSIGLAAILYIGGFF